MQGNDFTTDIVTSFNNNKNTRLWSDIQKKELYLQDLLGKTSNSFELGKWNLATKQPLTFLFGLSISVFTHPKCLCCFYNWYTLYAPEHSLSLQLLQGTTEEREGGKKTASSLKNVSSVNLVLETRQPKHVICFCSPGGEESRPMRSNNNAPHARIAEGSVKQDAAQLNNKKFAKGNAATKLKGKIAKQKRLCCSKE